MLQARPSAYLNIGNASMVQDAAESCVLATGACHEIVSSAPLNELTADRLLSFWRDWNPSKQKLKKFPDCRGSSRTIECEYKSVSNTRTNSMIQVFTLVPEKRVKAYAAQQYEDIEPQITELLDLAEKSIKLLERKEKTLKLKVDRLLASRILR